MKVWDGAVDRWPNKGLTRNRTMIPRGYSILGTVLRGTEDRGVTDCIGACIRDSLDPGRQGAPDVVRYPAAMHGRGCPSGHGKER